MKRKRTIIIIASIFLGLPIILLALLSLFGGAGREVGDPLPKSSIEIPSERSVIYSRTSSLQQEIINYWSQGKLEEWEDGEKIDLKNPRTVLGCLLAGKRVEEINEYLMAQKSTGTAGSRWLLNPKGGYNFNTMAFTPVLFLFGDKPELLYPETKEHLAKNILTIEGENFTRNVPYTNFQDSENHILMAESSRYLKNKWLWDHGNKSPDYDNQNNGVGEGLKLYLEEIVDYGIYEFNSDPYLGYTYSSLLNLNEFASGEVKDLSTKILDMINWQYALSSYKFKHFPPYRRRFKPSYKEEITSDYHSVMLMVMASFSDDSLELDITHGKHHALWPSMLSYRPPDKVLEWTLNKPGSYFVKMGHGYNSCPEIISGDQDYLLSAGGANQGRRSLIMPKPIVLFMDDEAQQLGDLFHLYGPGDNMMEWNNTGVYKDFACAKGSVHIPEGKQPRYASEGWEAYVLSDGLYLCIYSESELGLMVVVRSNSPEEAVKTVTTNNPDKNLYTSQFRHPNGDFIEYDLDASKEDWVIERVNNQAQQRKFDRWPLFDGDIDGS